MTVIPACWVEGCEKPATAWRGVCGKHYQSFTNTKWPVFLCPECGIDMREPDDACGFCRIEAVGVGA